MEEFTIKMMLCQVRPNHVVKSRFVFCFDSLVLQVRLITHVLHKYLRNPQSDISAYCAVLQRLKAQLWSTLQASCIHLRKSILPQDCRVVQTESPFRSA